MEEALRSIARSFAQNREAVPGFQRAALILLGLVALLQMALLARAWLRRREGFRAEAARHGLPASEAALVRELARRVGAAPLDLLGHLGLFERATALALAEAGPPGRPAGDLAARLRGLRRALGFDRLPPHAPLLSTRELMPGTAVELAGQPGQTLAVGEADFTVELAGPAVPTPAPGAEAHLSLTHAREARYTLRCVLLQVAERRGGRLRLVFAHDEAPLRVQQREYLRVPAGGPVALRPVTTWPGPRRELRAQLVDVSAGGALVTSAEALPAGLLAGASFLVGDAAFGDVRAVVLSSERRPDGHWRAHLEFGPMPEAERSRLVAAVERRELSEARARAPG
jgi:hypothetical protein